MRSRHIRVNFYLNKNECNKLQSLCNETGLSKSMLFRYMINGCVPKQMPPADYTKLFKEFNAIGRNLDQLLVVARTQKYINTPELMKALKEIDFLKNELVSAFNPSEE